MAFAIWITGLPGSGKSTIAKKLEEELKKKGVDCRTLRLDEIRKEIVPDPQYTDEEREYVYSKFVEAGTEIAAKGCNLIFDATAHKKKWRGQARERISDFVEVFVECDMQTCMKREEEREGGLVMADLYRKAVERREKGVGREGLGDVVGVDVPYEENPSAEVRVDSKRSSPEVSVSRIISVLEKKGLIK